MVPEIKPNGRGATPPFWRNVWGTFRELRQVADKAGVPTGQWGITVPPKGTRLFKTWELHYIAPGSRQLVRVPLGHNADEAIVILKRHVELYEQWARNRTPTKPITKKQVVPPHERPGLLRKYADLLSDQMRDPGKPIDPWYKEHIGRKRAGYLNVDLETYLRTKVGQMFPIPPRNKEEWEKFKEGYRYVEDQRRKAWSSGIG